MPNIEKIEQDLTQKLTHSTLKKEESMAKHTSFKVGGKADIFIQAGSIEDIQTILQYAKENEIPITIMGNGSNLLVKDKGIRGITIQIDLQELTIHPPQEGNVIVEAQAGVKLGYLGVILAKKGIAGFEFAAGIPGTIGGAIRMNAGAFKKEFKEIVTQITYLTPEGQLKTIANEEGNFSYRHSRFVEGNDIILSCLLQLQTGNTEEILANMQTYAQIRKEKQPQDMPSAGSTFKRGTNYITAQLIDEAGLKGYTIGGAQVSKKHAGFIVNTGKATTEDILNLIEHVTKVVYEKFGKVIEMEIEIVGE